MYDTSLDNFSTYEEYLDSHITKEDLMYLEDIELASSSKKRYPCIHSGLPLQDRDPH